MGIELLIRSIDAGAIRPTYGNNLDYILFGWLQAFQNHEDAFGKNITGYITRENVLHIRCPVVSIGADLFPIAVDIRLPPRFPESDPQCKLVHKDTGNNFPRGSLPISSSVVNSFDYQVDLKRLAALPGVNLPLKSYPPNQGTPSLVQILAAISNLVNDALEPVMRGTGAGANNNNNNNSPLTIANNNNNIPPPPSGSPPQNNNNVYRDPMNNSSPRPTSIVTSSIVPPSLAANNTYNNNNTNNNGSSPASATIIKGVHLGPPSGGSASGGFSSPSPSSPSLPPASKEIVNAVSFRVKEFFEQREAALKTLGHLQSSQDTLQRLLKSLNHKKDTLMDANQEVTQMGSLCDQVVKAKPTSALKCIEASDPLSAQGFALLAEVQACDDVMEALEKRLRPSSSSSNNNVNMNNKTLDTLAIIPGTANSFALGASASNMSLGMNANHNNNNGNAHHETATTHYLRLVGNIARRQFMAKFLLRKVQGKRLASRSLMSLINRFPGLDPSVISAVLESNAYDAAATAQRLTEMTRV